MDAEFHDALDEFPFPKPHQPLSTSDPSYYNDTEATSSITIIPDHTPYSPSSPSSAGLRHRRLVSSQSQFFKKNPDGLIDFDPQPKNHMGLKDNEKLDASSDFSRVSDGQIVNDESTESITVDSPNSGQDFLFMLAELVILVISFQTKLLLYLFKFPVWLINISYMLLNDPYSVVIGHVRNNSFGIWGICYSSGVVKLVNYLWLQNHESVLKLCVRIGWGLLWFVYCGIVLVCLLVPSFVFGGVMMKWVVEEPVQITERLSFDYTKDAPVAFVPVVYCLESPMMVHKEKSKIGGVDGLRVVPFGHELRATVSLVLPESDYNRNLGIFQVRVDFLSSDGKLLASTRKPSMLQFKSEPIRLLSTFIKIAYLFTGYPSETQTLDIQFSGYTEKDIPLSWVRAVIQQRAEFAKGGGVPEIYSASLKLESQLPFLKRMLWYWKGLIYMWISVTMFLMELLFTLLCCTPVVFSWVRRVGGSSINDAVHNKRPG